MLVGLGEDRNPDMTNASVEKDSLVGLTASIVSANVSNSPVGTHDLCDMILSVHSALSSLATTGAVPMAAVEAARREPAVPIEESIQHDFIVCLEDGKKLKTLKRHLRAKYQMSPEEYRAKWGLPIDYPMAAPSYLDQRRQMAHKIGLGLRPKAGRSKGEEGAVSAAAEKRETPARRRRRTEPWTPHWPLKVVSVRPVQRAMGREGYATVCLRQRRHA